MLDTFLVMSGSTRGHAKNLDSSISYLCLPSNPALVIARRTKDGRAVAAAGGILVEEPAIHNFTNSTRLTDRIFSTV